MDGMHQTRQATPQAVATATELFSSKNSLPANWACCNCGHAAPNKQTFVLEGYEVPWKLVTEVMQCRCAEMHHKKARQVLELMVASGSVRVVVSSPGNVSFSAKEPVVLSLSVDYNKFLCLEQMRLFTDLSDELESSAFWGLGFQDDCRWRRELQAHRCRAQGQ